MAVVRVNPLSDLEHRVLAQVEHRARTVGQVATSLGLTPAEARRTLGGLIARGLLDEDHGFYFRRLAP